MNPGEFSDLGRDCLVCVIMVSGRSEAPDMRKLSRRERDEGFLQAGAVQATAMIVATRGRVLLCPDHQRLVTDAHARGTS